LLNLNETNTLDYGQTSQNNIVYNTLQSKLPLSPSNNDNLSPHQDDIISLLSDTDIEYLQDFNNYHIPLTNRHQLSMQQLFTQLFSSQHSATTTDKPSVNNNNNKPDASQTTNNMITDQDTSILHQPSHVTDSNASTVTNVADIINHVINIQGLQETLDNSIHASRSKPIIKLPHNDLCHTLNKT